VRGHSEWHVRGLRRRMALRRQRSAGSASEAAAAAAARAVAIVGESCGAGRARRQWHEVASVAVLRQAHVGPMCT